MAKSFFFLWHSAVDVYIYKLDRIYPGNRSIGIETLLNCNDADGFVVSKAYFYI